MATLKYLEDWMARDLGRFAGEDHIEPVGVGSKEADFRIYTDTNSYLIRAVEREDGGYLGCTSSCRKPRAGEDWTRGSDLSDGKLTEETWRKILGDIVSYEMVRVHQSADAPLPTAA